MIDFTHILRGFFTGIRTVIRFAPCQWSTCKGYWSKHSVNPLAQMVKSQETTTKLAHILWNILPWWRHQMETFSALLALSAGNAPVTGEFPSQRPVTRSFDVFFDLLLNKRLSKQSRGWWFETPSRSLCGRCNAHVIGCSVYPAPAPCGPWIQ